MTARSLTAPPLFTLALLAGCGAPESSLSQFSVGELLILQLPTSAEGSGPILVLNMQGQDCLTLTSGVTAQVNGHPMELVNPGGSAPGVIPFFPDCDYPTFQSNLSAEQLGLDAEVSTFVVEEGETRFVFEATHLGTPRSLALRQPLDGVLSAGAQVEVEISPGTDVLNGDGTWASFVADCGAGWEIERSAIQLDGSTLRFTVPAAAGAARGHLTVVSRGAVAVRRCEGVASCRAPTEYSIRVPATVAGNGEVCP